MASDTVQEARAILPLRDHFQSSLRRHEQELLIPLLAYPLNVDGGFRSWPAGWTMSDSPTVSYTEPYLTITDTSVYLASCILSDPINVDYDHRDYYLFVFAGILVNNGSGYGAVILYYYDQNDNQLSTTIFFINDRVNHTYIVYPLSSAPAGTAKVRIRIYARYDSASSTGSIKVLYAHIVKTVKLSYGLAYDSLKAASDEGKTVSGISELIPRYNVNETFLSDCKLFLGSSDASGYATFSSRLYTKEGFPFIFRSSLPSVSNNRLFLSNGVLYSVIGTDDTLNRVSIVGLWVPWKDKIEYLGSFARFLNSSTPNSPHPLIRKFTADEIQAYFEERDIQTRSSIEYDVKLIRGKPAIEVVRTPHSRGSEGMTNDIGVMLPANKTYSAASHVFNGEAIYESGTPKIEDSDFLIILPTNKQDYLLICSGDVPSTQTYTDATAFVYDLRVMGYDLKVGNFFAGALFFPVRNLFYEAESLTLVGGATVVSDANASGGQTVSLASQNHEVKNTYQNITQSLPIGKYQFIFRVKSSTNAPLDAPSLLISITNSTDGTTKASATRTYLNTTYRYEYLTFQIDSSDANDIFTFSIKKTNTTVGIGYIDLFAIVPLERIETTDTVTGTPQWWIFPQDFERMNLKKVTFDVDVE